MRTEHKAKVSKFRDLLNISTIELQVHSAVHTHNLGLHRINFEAIFLTKILKYQKYFL